MTNLRACVVPVSLAAAVLAVVPAFATNTIDSVTINAGQRINNDSAMVVAGNSDYLIMDNGARYLWDVKNGVYVSAPEGNNNYTSISGNVVAGNIGTSTYTWTISGGYAAPTQVRDGASADDANVTVYGNAGGLVVGVKTVEPIPGFPIPSAVYNVGGQTHVLPQDDGSQLEDPSGIGFNNPIYNYSRANAVTQHISTSTYTVGGLQSNMFGQNFATIWHVNTSNDSVSTVTLSSNTNSEVTAVSGNLQGGYITKDDGIHQAAVIWRGVAGSELALADSNAVNSDVAAVAEAVTTIGGVFDIAVGSINTGLGDHAALWLIDGDAFRLIELADPTSQSLMYSYASGIGLDAQGNLAAIYGYGTPDGGQGIVPLVWSVDGLGSTPVPEPLAAGMLTVGFGAFLLRRPRRAN